DRLRKGAGRAVGSDFGWNRNVETIRHFRRAQSSQQVSWRNLSGKQIGTAADPDACTHLVNHIHVDRNDGARLELQAGGLRWHDECAAGSRYGQRRCLAAIGLRIVLQLEGLRDMGCEARVSEEL